MGRDHSAIKIIELNPLADVDKNYLIREYLTYKMIPRDYSENFYLAEHFETWFEESVDQSRISLYIEMEICDIT
jgi:hypothetical protein